MTQLVYKRNFENATVFLSSTILNCSQSAYTCMEDVLQFC